MKVFWRVRESRPDLEGIELSSSADDAVVAVVSASDPEGLQILKRPLSGRPFMIVIDKKASDWMRAELSPSGVIVVKDPEQAQEVLLRLKESEAFSSSESLLKITVAVIDTDSLDLQIAQAYFTDSFFREVAEKFLPFIKGVKVQAELFLVEDEEAADTVIHSVREKEPLLLVSEIAFSEWNDAKYAKRDSFRQFIREAENLSLDDLIERSKLTQFLVETGRKWKKGHSLTIPVLLTEGRLFEKVMPLLIPEGVAMGIAKPLIPDPVERLALSLLRYAFSFKSFFLAREAERVLSGSRSLLGPNPRSRKTKKKSRALS